MTHTIEDLNLNQWYIERELVHCPKHFVSSSVKYTSESYEWVLEKLVGRFSTVTWSESSIRNGQSLAFEDPSEMLFYELVWG